MAEKPKKETEAAPAAAAEKPAAKSGGIGALLSKTPVILGGVMLLEAVVLFAGFKFLGSGAPKTANGADLVQDSAKVEGSSATQPSNASAGKNQTVEMNLVDFKALNKLSGHSFLYDVSIDVTVKPEFEDRVKNAIKDRDALIKDRVRTIIAELDPEKLGGASEPGLETLKRQVKFQLDQVLGDGLVDEVLVSRCIPIRTDY
jgi:flagellar basal body-associated protein FliL